MRQPYLREDHAALAEKGERATWFLGGEGRKYHKALAEKERTMLLCQSGDPIAATQLMVLGA